MLGSRLMPEPTNEIGRDEIPDFRQRPATLSATYLSQAVDAFGLTNDPPTLYTYLYGRDLDSTGRALAVIEAGRVRLNCSMRAVLFAALAAESYVNEFLAAHLSRQDRDAMDRLPTVSKYVLGFRIGSDREPFKRDRWPIPILKDLFTLRDRLVHPKPGFGPEPVLGPLGSFEEQFTGEQVARYLIAVACAGLVVVKETYGPDHLDLWTDLIWFGRDVIHEFASEATALPPVDGPPSVTLGRRLIEARSTPQQD